MSIYKELNYENETDLVKRIQFSVMSPDEIRKRSVVEVTKNEVFVGSEPVQNGLFDPRMGVIDHNKICMTCEQRNTFCPGHFGHITLGKPVFYIQFLKYVEKILKCICFRCSKVLIDTNNTDVKAIINKKISAQKRWEALHKHISKTRKKCEGCSARQPDKIMREGVIKIAMEWKEKNDEKNEESSASAPPADAVRKLVLSAEDVLKILRRMTDQDIELLGFSTKYNRPEWMICTVLPVPPPAVRPSVRTDVGQRSEDDLTHKLSNIIKANNQLKQKMEKGVKDQIELSAQLLQYEVATLIDNQIPGIPPAQQRTGRPLRSLSERLKSKEGRIRGNLMGKRVDFSARSVITPDPCISIDELGVPIRIAMNLTYPEIVNKYNRNEMMKLVRNGPDIYPGAKYVRKMHPARTIRLKGIDRTDIQLENGDVVERHLRNGDYVLFNRQPSLHKMSMMAHRVRVMPYNTFRLNVCVTPSFNADFDGDEMNAHVPQSIQTHEELAQLAAVPTQIISPREAKPIISIVQDIALGVYRMTKNHVRIPQKQFFNILATCPSFYGHLPDPGEKALANPLAPVWTGKQMLSMILPKGVNIRTKNSAKNSGKEEDIENTENFVIIENGELKQGIIDKEIYQARTTGLVHSIFNEYGPDITRQFFDNTQKFVCDWLVLNGFSVGISDLIVDDTTIDAFKKVIGDMKVKVHDIMKKIHVDSFENLSTKNNSEYFEQEVNNILNKANGDVGSKGLNQINDISNRMINMIKSGSKGNSINVAQMIGCLGQQNVDGRRIPYGFDDRTLPHFTKYDDGPESRGFVENSFIHGLTPQEFFFHSMGGREGLIDTAVKSVTGDTPIVVLEDGVCKYVTIGNWIDRHLKERKEDVAHFDERQMEYLYLNKDSFIPTTDEDGNVTWGKITAVTRHDPGTELYQIKTAGGKSVIVTESKSLLTWHADLGKFKEVPTPEIKVGDFVPVTANLMTPPVVVNAVDMDAYFPKTKYIYGTEFVKAQKCINTAMIDRDKIEDSWWQRNNGGVSFTLPYDSKATLVRAVTRSSAVEPGYIYPYHATREHGRIPEAFELNHDNGVFIGLFLAEGNANVKSGIVNITNANTDVMQFVKKWFDGLSITHKEHSKTNSIGGVSTGVVGYSRMLAQFLDSFVGYGARDKYVPDVAFVAPDEFIVGILSGYFSGDGTISKNSVESGSASERLTHGISMICTRLGIFGKVFTTQTKRNNIGTIDIAASHRFSIRAQWAKLFADKVELLVESKNKQLRNIKCSEEHRNFQSKNDVVLDKIVEITVLDTAKYPKVYDLTIPSTLNFGLANGLQVRDTSDTGYIQRKLVKAMEDCKVNYDFSVRNASGSIVQFLYGEDGMDAGKIENQYLQYIDMDYPKLRKTFLISPEDYTALATNGYLDKTVISALSDNKAASDILQKHFDQILQDREFIINKVFKKKHENAVRYPIAFNRILLNAKNALAKYKCNALSDLNPIYVLERIDAMISELTLRNTNLPADEDIDEKSGTYLLKILLRCNLSPKKLITEHRLDKKTFDFVEQQIKQRFFESLVHPSEMVGVIAAQSIGEPTTQLTLNTFHMSGVSSASSAVRGVPRLRELMSVTKNMKTPIMNIYLKPEYQTDKQKCMHIMNHVRTIRFRDVVKTCKIYFDPHDFNTSLPEDRDVMDMYKMFRDIECQEKAQSSPWLLRMEFDRSKLLNFRLSMIDLHHALTNFYDDTVQCVFSDDNSQNLIARIKLIVKEECDDMLTELRALEHNIMENVSIKGIKYIERVSLHEETGEVYNSDASKFEKQSQWVIDTEGSNLMDVLGQTYVDNERTFTNNVPEIYEVLGIEAARLALYNEIMDVLFQVGVNYRHIALLVDTMTNKGHLLSIDRHGINRGDIGPLAKCSFEEVNDMLIKAGVFAEVDKINGVSANIMLGQIPPCGTGESRILIDEQKLGELNIESLVDEDHSEDDDPDDEPSHQVKDSYCDNIKINFSLPGKLDNVVKKSPVAIKIIDSKTNNL